MFTLINHINYNNNLTSTNQASIPPSHNNAHPSFNLYKSTSFGHHKPPRQVSSLVIHFGNPENSKHSAYYYF